MPNSNVARFTGRFILIVAFVFGAFGIYNYSKYVALQSRISEIKLAGGPVSLADIPPVELADGEDIAIQVAPFLETIVEIANGMPIVDISTKENELVSADAIEKFELVYESNPELFAIIPIAAACKGIAYSDLYSQAPLGILDWQKLMRIMDWKAQVRLAQGNPDEAARTCLEMLRIANAIERPTLLNFALAQAYRISACAILFDVFKASEVDTEILAQLKTELESVSPYESYRFIVQAERAFAIDGLMHPELVDDNHQETSFIYQVRGVGASMMGGTMLDEFDIAIERADAALSTQFEPRAEAVGFIPNPYDNAADYYERFRIKVGASQAFARAARILIGLRYSNQNLEKSEWSQDDLVGIGVPRSVTIDPFTDKPMVVKKTEKGWQVYSLGPDKVDGAEPFSNYGTETTKR